MKRHLVETRCPGRGGQSSLRFGIARRIVVDKKYRAADHHALQFVTALRLRDLAQVPQIADHDVDIARAEAGRDLGCFVHEIGAENAFDRAHEPAVEAIDVRADGVAAVTARVVIGADENGRRHVVEARFELGQAHAAAGGIGECGIGRAEVNCAVVQPILLAAQTRLTGLPLGEGRGS